MSNWNDYFAAHMKLTELSDEKKTSFLDIFENLGNIFIIIYFIVNIYLNLVGIYEKGICTATYKNYGTPAELRTVFFFD